MPRVVAKPDNLNERSLQFDQQAIREPVFLNTVPKSGTHLIRNIMRMFVPVHQHYDKEFIQYAILREHQAAFSRAQPKLSWGHLLFGDDSVIALRQVRHVLLVRDPYDWVLARTRFFLSDSFQGSLDHLKGGNVSLEEMMNLMIFGISDKAPGMDSIFIHNAVSWLGTDAHLVRFEDLLKHVRNVNGDAAERFFSNLFDRLGMGDLPGDWQERVRVGADRQQSGTARENLAGSCVALPSELPEAQKRLVDFAVPGLREILGYS